jgi:hypothetical protein
MHIIALLCAGVVIDLIPVPMACTTAAAEQSSRQVTASADERDMLAIFM